MLALTGERTAPGWDRERYWFLRHRVVYRWVAERHAQPGYVVADIGSGEGYGAALFADQTRPVIAVELDEATCQHAQRAYPQVDSVCANVVGLPLASGSVDLVTSLQVIEHVWDVSGYLAELRRISRGRVVISTPNRPVFSPGLARHEKPVNPFHVEEFDAEQLAAYCVAAGFLDVHVLGVHHGPGIRSWERSHGSIMAALVDAAQRDDWTGPVLAAQAALDECDFLITTAVEGAQDLIAIAT